MLAEQLRKQLLKQWDKLRLFPGRSSIFLQACCYSASLCILPFVLTLYDCQWRTFAIMQRYAL